MFKLHNIPSFRQDSSAPLTPGTIIMSPTSQDVTNSALARRISMANNDIESVHREEIKEIKNMFESMMKDM